MISPENLKKNKKSKKDVTEIKQTDEQDINNEIEEFIKENELRTVAYKKIIAQIEKLAKKK